MLFGNLFALRSTDPKVLYTSYDPVGPENDYWLSVMAKAADKIVLAWGEHGCCRFRDQQVVRMLKYPALHWAGRDSDMIFTPKPLYCFSMNKSGQPKHPLYLPRTAETQFLTRDWLERRLELRRTPEDFKKMYMGEFLDADN